MEPALTTSRRAELRAAAHSLKPVVIIGDKGLTDMVIAEVERALDAHELIKVRASSDDRVARSAWMDEICGRLDAHPVQEIGKILVIYRANPEKKPAPEKAKPAPKEPAKRPSGWKPAKKPRVKPDATGTERRRSRTPSPRPASGPRRRRPSTSR